MHNSNGLRAFSTLAAFLVAISIFTAGNQASAQSGSQLRRSLNRIEREKAEARRKLKTAKAEQATYRNELVEAQQDLAEAERHLKAAEWQLESTRVTIRRVKQELANTEATLNRHKSETEQRILVTFKSGTPSYVEVLLNAADFNDFANRAEFNARMAAEDSRLLQAMLDYHKRRDQQQAQLRSKEQEQISLRRKVTQQRNAVAEKKATAQQLLHKASTDRATYERQLAQFEAESRAIGEMLAKLASGSGVGGSYKGKWAGTFAWPMTGRLSSPYGMRMHPILGYRKMHTGIDIARAGGTPIKAAAAGRVIYAGWRGAYGVCVIIDHGSGMSTVYGHLQSGSLRVCRGQNVSRGQMIGRCGTTGRSTGNHLHFEVRVNGRHVNPMNYL